MQNLKYNTKEYKTTNLRNRLADRENRLEAAKGQGRHRVKGED